MNRSAPSPNWQSEELYRLIVESARDYAIFAIDLENRVMTWNSGAQRILRYSLKEVIGKSARIFFTPEDRKKGAPEKEISRARKFGRSENERWHLRKDKTRYWGSGLMMPLRDPKGRIVGYLKIMRDETARRMAEATAQQFQLLVENIQDYAVMMLDPHGKVVAWNVGAERLHGYESREIVGKSARKFYTQQEQRKRVLEQELARAKRRGHSEMEGWRVRKDGSRFWANQIVRVMKGRDGKVSGFAVISRDLTESKESQDALLMLNQTLESRVRARTLAMEEYQNKLRNLAQQLTRTERLERERLAGELHENLGQMLALAEMRLTGFGINSTIEKGAKIFQDVKGYLGEAVKYTRSLMADLSPPFQSHGELSRAMRWIAQDMKKHGLEAKLRDDGKSKPVSGELQAVLYQAVRELLYNVIKHSGVNKASLSLARAGNLVEIRVVDRGAGFRQAWRTEELQATSGFGLFHLSERIKAFGGALEIRSKKGKGTEVIVRAPLLRTSHKQVQSPSLAPEPSATKKRVKVLIVDDNAMMRKGLKEILAEDSGIEIVGEASDGIAAARETARCKPDILLMDANMPGGGGIEATRAITSKRSHPAVLGLSIREDGELESRFLRAGAAAFLSKRESSKKLRETIHRLTKGRG